MCSCEKNIGCVAVSSISKAQESLELPKAYIEPPKQHNQRIWAMRRQLDNTTVLTITIYTGRTRKIGNLQSRNQSLILRGTSAKNKVKYCHMAQSYSLILGKLNTDSGSGSSNIVLSWSGFQILSQSRILPLEPGGCN